MNSNHNKFPPFRRATRAGLALAHVFCDGNLVLTSLLVVASLTGRRVYWRCSLQESEDFPQKRHSHGFFAARQKDVRTILAHNVAEHPVKSSTDTPSSRERYGGMFSTELLSAPPTPAVTC